MNQLNIAVLFGGCSPEYSVSLESAESVIRHMDRSKYTPIPVGITRGGDWYCFTGDIDRIADDTWANGAEPLFHAECGRLDAADCIPAVLSPDRSIHGLLLFQGGGMKALRLDAVFPVLHGKNGEDGTVQGLCALAGIPLVGCGTLASALCMDKLRAHALAAATGVAVPASFALERGFDEAAALRSADAIGYPLFVKPVKAGSSYGITIVKERSELFGAIEKAFRYDDRVLAEERIPGFEAGCAVMGNESLTTGEIDEIELTDGFFDFTEKYNLITSKIHVPARISTEKSAELKETAKIVYRALDCRGLARVDMFLTPTGRIVFNEVNTIPGFTAHSRFPGMMQAAGVPLAEVISRAIELGVRQ